MSERHRDDMNGRGRDDEADGLLARIAEAIAPTLEPWKPRNYEHVIVQGRAGTVNHAFDDGSAIVEIGGGFARYDAADIEPAP